MPISAVIVKCKKCGFEIRSDWKFCPSCGDKIVCTDKDKDCCSKKA
jgi:lipopolysaccharide biosynthesis regulator YciM